MVNSLLGNKTLKLFSLLTTFKVEVFWFLDDYDYIKTSDTLVKIELMNECK